MKSVTPTIRELLAILKPMSWKARLDYLWTYYKIVPVIVVCVIAVISIVITAVQNGKIETLHSGALFGVTISEEDAKVLSDDLLALFEGNGKDRVVNYQTLQYFDGDDPIHIEGNRSAVMQLLANIAAGSLDYVIFSEAAYKNYVYPDGYYEDLRKVLTAQQLEELSEMFAWTEKTEEINSYPVALDISGTEFAKCCNRMSEKLYLVIPIGNPNRDRSSLFVDYLLNWKP